MNKKLKDYLKQKDQEYIEKGFKDHKDVENIETFNDTDLIEYKKVEKEISRCQFLLDMIKEIERKNNKGEFD